MGLGAWEDNPPKELLLIATPHTGLVNYEWAVYFKILQPPCAFNIISNRGLPIDRARCDLIAQAKSTGATHIFFIDSDVLVPHDGLLRLWSHRLPIVAGIYGSKHETTDIWIENSKSGDSRYAAVLPQVLESDQLFSHPDMVTGLGCCLINMQVFNKLEEPYFYWTQGREKSGISEDFYFFEQVRKAGIPIHVDTSVKCFHIDYCKLTWSGQRERLTL